MLDSTGCLKLLKDSGRMHSKILVIKTNACVMGT